MCAMDDLHATTRHVENGMTLRTLLVLHNALLGYTLLPPHALLARPHLPPCSRRFLNHWMCAPSALDTFTHETAMALSNGSFIKLSLRSNEGESQADENDPLARLKRIDGRLVRLKRKGEKLQLTLKYQHRDTCMNVGLEEVEQNLAHWLRSGGFRRGRLLTVDADLVVERRKAGHKLQRLKPTASSAPPLDHDRRKGVPVEATSDFLQALGVTKPDGSPRAGKSAKLRQIEKFVETIAALVKRGVGSVDGGDDGGGSAGGGVGGGRSGPGKSLRIVDAGCGRGYLTFASHAYFDQLGWDVKTAGVEIRKDLVTSMNGVARGLGAGFDGLVFEHAQVSEYLAALGGMDPSDPDGGVLTSSSRVDVLVALHACDTATDDALWCGISNGARVIVTAPCCHKQVRRQLEVDESRPRGPLDAALRHGIYRERTAEMVTDTLRSLLLEIGGYDVSVFEFVGGEHTAKNVMIAAVKRKHLRSDAELAERRAEFNAMCEQFSVREQALAVWMGEHARQPMEPPATGNSLMGAPAAAVGAGAASLAKPSRRSPRAQPPAARLPPA